MKKNVLIVAYDGMNKSGVPSVIMEICRGLHEQCNFSIAIFDCADNQFHFDELGQLGVSVIKIPAPQFKNKLQRKLFNIFKKQRYFYNQFKNLFFKYNFDIIHSFKEADSYPIFKAAKDSGISNLILHTTVLHTYKHIRDYKTKKNLKKSAKLASLRVGGSSLSCELAFKNRPFTVITNCYNSGAFKQLPITSNNLELVHVGYYSPNKNQIFSLRVLNLIKNDYPSTILHFIGNQNDTNYFSLVKSESQKLRLEKNVVYHDGNKDQREVLSRCVASLVPSKLEGFSLVLVESQASGIKCFANENLPKDANAGGIEFLPLDESIWAENIIQLYKSGNVRFNFDMTKFSRETFVKNISKLYFEN